MSKSSHSSDWFEPGSPSDATSAIYCDEGFSEDQSISNSDDSKEVEEQSFSNSDDSDDSGEVEQPRMATVPQDSEEVEQQNKANPHDDSDSDDLLPSSRLSPITNAELKETILEPQTIVTEFDPADPYSFADVADCDQQGDVADVRVFSPRNFSFQELLNSDDTGFLKSDWNELGAPSDVAPSVVAPSVVAPSDVAPSDVAPSDAASSDAASSDTASNEVEKRIPDHENNDWREYFDNREGDD